MTGYIESAAGVHFWALNIEGDDVAEAWPPHTRAELVKELLRRLDIMGRSENVPEY